MTRLGRSAALAALALVVGLGCARPAPRTTLEVGHHRVRLVVPEGWEHLDHGRQHLFRKGEMSLSLTVLGLTAREADPSAPPPSPDSLARLALAAATDMRRHEIARQGNKIIRGAEWAEVESWDRVTHLGRERLACLEVGGSLLVLHTERGPIEQTGPVFEALLASIEATPLEVISR